MLLDFGEDITEQSGKPIECVRVLVEAVHIIYHAVPYSEIYALSPLAYKLTSSYSLAYIHSLEKSIGKEFFELYARSGITTVKKF